MVRCKTQNGNAMVYVLIALALFGALTLTLSSQNDQADGQEISDEQAELYALELIEYAASAQNVIDQMIATGTDIDELDFIIPTDAAFDTPPHIHKVYHPQGGGLNYVSNLADQFKGTGSNPNTAWFILNSTNAEWTSTTANDIFLSALRIHPTICTRINTKISGSSNIPVTTQTIDDIFETGAEELNSTNCPDCIGYPSFCVESSDGGNNFGFYNIIATR